MSRFGGRGLEMISLSSLEEEVREFSQICTYSEECLFLW